MSENPVRTEIDLPAGGGWGAPLTAEVGPAQSRRPALLLSGLVSRVSKNQSPSPVVRPRLGGLAAVLDGTSARAAAAPFTALRPRPSRTAPPRPAAARHAPGRAAPPQLRTVSHVDLRSVAKVSMVFYGVVLVVMVVASVLLWAVADAAGAVHSIDHSVQSLFGVKNYSLHPMTIALYSCAAGAVVAVTGTLANVLVAGIYNLIADIVGGVRIKITDT